MLDTSFLMRGESRFMLPKQSSKTMHPLILGLSMWHLMYRGKGLLIVLTVHKPLRYKAVVTLLTPVLLLH